MQKFIVQLFESVLRPPTSGPGRHRPAVRPWFRPAVRCRRVMVSHAAVDFAPGYFPTLRSTSGALARSPAQISYERWERVTRRLQQQRRRDLWLASYGIDAGPRLLRIHGIAVAR